MASYPQGYDEKRFVVAVNRNFICSICFNVLKHPVLCPRNQHCFCRACITKYLESSQRCPTCADELTVDTLTEASRIVKDFLNELNVHCKYVNRGCHEIVQLQHLDRHEATCGFSPVACTNQGCGLTVNKRDLVHHERGLCEFRKLKCHSCGEMTNTLADMEKRMADVETKIGKVEAIETKITNMETKVGNLERNIERSMENMQTNMKRNIEDLQTDMDGKLDAVKEKLSAVNNEVRGLKAVLIEGFNEMKDVLVKMEDMKKEETRQVRPAPSSNKEYIIVAGGDAANSVEIFNWRQKLWSHLQSLPTQRCGATSFVYNNHVTVAGGYCSGSGLVDNMIKMNIDPKPDPSTNWSECPVRLPAKLQYHSSVLYKDQLIVTGGYNGNVTSDHIDEVQLVPPFAVKTLSRMPQPRQFHNSEILDKHVLIVGGKNTRRCPDSLSSVVLYDIEKNECKQLAPLPYKVSQMATVRWGDNIIVIGGRKRHDRILDTVISYNVETEQHHMLPSMRCKRYRSIAVVIGNNIVVLGGRDEKGHYVKSVEAFNFDRHAWEELPEMSEERFSHTAVVV